MKVFCAKIVMNRNRPKRDYKKFKIKTRTSSTISWFQTLSTNY